ncbi:MAG: 4Fe-4S dicluster domain-containing protein [Alphaproteobacteria bacterium]|nr:4Fe-4S dicluster domain-containing protein [Alphaproteobacteria bacterium]
MAERPQVLAGARNLGRDDTGDSPAARLTRLKEGDTVTARIFCFDPASDAAPRFETHRVPYTKWMRVLEVLTYVSEELGGDLAHRWFCANRMCGTCAVRVNGREVLACWEPVEPEMTIEPLRNAPVVRDLVIDRTAYERRVVALTPWLVRQEPYPGFPEPLTHRAMAPTARALDCISCMCCFSACPVVGLGQETSFAGPAPLVQLARVALDPRDGIDRGRIALEHGAVFDCISCYKCEEVCPVSIPIVTGAIEPLKALAFKSVAGKSRHARVFLKIVQARGRIDPSALVLGVQRLAALRHPLRIFKLWRRGKIDPLKTMLGFRLPDIEQIRQIYQAVRGGPR